MKLTRTTKFSCLAALLLAAVAPNLHAFTYTNERAEVLLVFRKAGALNDVLFNLGTVSNFLSKPNNSTFTVTNFRLGALTANYGANLSSVSMSLVAVTTATDPSLRAWVTDPDASAPRNNITGSRFGSIRSKVDAIGQFPEDATFNSPTNEYIIVNTEGSSPTYIMSSGGSQDAATLSGAVLFSIEGTITTSLTLRFWELAAVGSASAATQVGSFTISQAGVLTFTRGSAGTPPPNITQEPANATIFAGGTTNFSVVASGATSYQWQFNSANISGATSSSYSLTAHTSNAGPYRVIVSNTGGSVTSQVATLTVNLPAASSLGQSGKPTGSSFQLKLTGTASAYYEVQSNTDLNNTNGWTTLALITNSGGMTIFTDSAATNSHRFYRAIAR